MSEVKEKSKVEQSCDPEHLYPRNTPITPTILRDPSIFIQSRQELPETNDYGRYNSSPYPVLMGQIERILKTRQSEKYEDIVRTKNETCAIDVDSSVASNGEC
jgi:hypothetical protein